MHSSKFFNTDAMVTNFQRTGYRGFFLNNDSSEEEFFMNRNEINQEQEPELFQGVFLNLENNPKNQIFIQTNYNEGNSLNIDENQNLIENKNQEEIHISFRPTGESTDTKKFNEGKKENNLQKEEKIHSNKNEKVFDVITPTPKIGEKEESMEEDSIVSEKKYQFDFDNFDDVKRERFLKRRRRRENQDNMRKKIKRTFLNNYLFNKINILLKQGKKRHNNFERFPQKFVSDVVKKANNDILKLTLKQIIKKKELCFNQKDIDNYNHNMKVLESLENEKNIELEKILNTTYGDLFTEYINSDEFKIDEINRLKKKDMSDWYIKIYVNLSRHFVEFFEDI